MVSERSHDGYRSMMGTPGLSRLAGRPLARMNGVGNAILVLDLRGTDVVVEAAEARAFASVPGLALRPADDDP